MPEAPVIGAQRSTPVALDDAVFGARFHEALVHESVRAEQAARRRGTASTKTRGMVSGGGAKPWRQKGTGRARAGSNRSPLWTGGGTVFGPQPRSYTFKVNRKERRMALRSALSLHASRGSLAVLSDGAIDQPKTKQAVELLGGWDKEGPTLVVLDPTESAPALAFRNLPAVNVLGHEDVGVADLLRAASLILSRPALDALTARAASGSPAETATPPAASKTAKPAASKTAKPAAKPTAAKTAKPAATAKTAPASKAKPAKPAEQGPDAAAGSAVQDVALEAAGPSDTEEAAD
ncbi:MAG: 50S ribosomal protein L4 [Solirubrobacteraceae bacterium]